jgi:hypothetical protein
MIAVEILATLASDPNIPTPASVYLHKNRSLVLFNKVGDRFKLGKTCAGYRGCMSPLIRLSCLLLALLLLISWNIRNIGRIPASSQSPETRCPVRF